jgi:sugar lactone lactonase YvrE
MKAEVVLEAGATLGEGPLWCPREQALYWVDSLAPAIHRFVPVSGAIASWEMPATIGSIVLRQGGGALAALADGYAFVDLESGAVTALGDPEAETAATRFNDGKCDRRGRFWAGTMDIDQRAPLGALYRLDPNVSWHRLAEGVTVSNGLGWSPDDRTMYHVDSPSRRIFAYDFDVDVGAVANRRVFAEVPEGRGFPDGLTVDAEGFVWCAIWLGGRVERYAPDGRLDGTVELPVKRVTSCAFGGLKLDLLYVTTARWRGPARPPHEPPAGHLFAVETGAKGLPEPRFAG